jgi:stage V sporulation protein D (sporulation-specific penicillin-binding protein)
VVKLVQLKLRVGESMIRINTIGSFIGYGPTEDPKFVMIVNIDKPKDVKFAESTAAPAFGKIAEFILNYYQVPPTR